MGADSSSHFEINHFSEADITADAFALTNPIMLFCVIFFVVWLLAGYILHQWVDELYRNALSLQEIHRFWRQVNRATWLQIAGTRNWDNFMQMLVWKTRRQHLWLSIVSRHPGDFLTAFKRLTLLITLLFNEMMVVALFFGTDPKFPGISVEFTYVIVTAALGLPFPFLISWLFQRAPPPYFYVDTTDEMNSCLRPVILAFISDADSARRPQVESGKAGDDDDDDQRKDLEQSGHGRPDTQAQTQVQTQDHSRGSSNSDMGSDTDDKGYYSADFYVPKSAQRALDLYLDPEIETPFCNLKRKNGPDTLNPDYTYRDVFAITMCVAFMMASTFVQCVLSVKVGFNTAGTVVRWLLLFGQDFMLRLVLIALLQFMLFCPWLYKLYCCNDKDPSNVKLPDGWDVLFQAGILGFKFKDCKVQVVDEEEPQARGRVNQGWTILAIDGRPVNSDEEINKYLQIAHKTLHEFVIRFQPNEKDGEAHGVLSEEVKAYRGCRPKSMEFNLEDRYAENKEDAAKDSEKKRRTWENRRRTAMRKRSKASLNDMEMEAIKIGGCTSTDLGESKTAMSAVDIGMSLKKSSSTHLKRTMTDDNLLKELAACRETNSNQQPTFTNKKDVSIEVNPPEAPLPARIRRQKSNSNLQFNPIRIKTEMRDMVENNAVTLNNTGKSLFKPSVNAQGGADGGLLKSLTQNKGPVRDKQIQNPMKTPEKQRMNSGDMLAEVMGSASTRKAVSRQNSRSPNPAGTNLLNELCISSASRRSRKAERALLPSRASTRDTSAQRARNNGNCSSFETPSKGSSRTARAQNAEADISILTGGSGRKPKSRSPTTARRSPATVRRSPASVRRSPAVRSPQTSSRRQQPALLAPRTQTLPVRERKQPRRQLQYPPLADSKASARSEPRAHSAENRTWNSPPRLTPGTGVIEEAPPSASRGASRASRSTAVDTSDDEPAFASSSGETSEVKTDKDGADEGKMHSEGSDLLNELCIDRTNMRGKGGRASRRKKKRR